MTQEEIRESVGLPPLEETEETVNEDANFSKLKTFNKIGTVDGKPVFSTIEEAVAHAKTLGCEGYHEHDLNGITSYMACEEHSEATDLTEVTELTKFIQEYGEDISEDWELIDEENASSEHQDFDFEKTLNEVANEKTMLASTGTAIPSRKSEQDGQSKKTGDYFRVRYVYAQDNFLQNKSGQKRDFCRQMMGANKLYRKEDIINMGSKVVNAGWGARGADTYSIWLADQHNCANSLKTNKLEFEEGFDNINVEDELNLLKEEFGDDIIRELNVEALLRKIFQIIVLKKRTARKRIRVEVENYINTLEKRIKKQKEVFGDDDHFDEYDKEYSLLTRKKYEKEKYNLQVELLKLQEWVVKNNKKVAIVFEGRDAAGKGSTIKRFVEYLNPKHFRVVVMGIPTEEEKNNWFQRYEKELPKEGEIVFFDRSWYNRAVVEPAMGYCTEEQYKDFMNKVVTWEQNLIRSGTILIKFWFSITKEKQLQRFNIRQE